MKLASIILIFTFFCISFSEEFGLIRGSVLNKENNQPLPSVNVLIQGTLIGTTSDSKGNFLISKVKPGKYTLLVSFVGFKKQEVRDVVVEAGKETYLEIKLEPGAVQMGQVIVTAGKYEQTFSDVPASVSVVQAREIYSRNIVNVDDALRHIGGVSLIESQISIRGSNGYSKGVGSRALVLVDGIPLITGDTGEPIFESMPVNFIERIEVLKGASSALYGSGALGGVINIITRDIPENSFYSFKIYGGFYNKTAHKQWRWNKATRYLNGFDLAHSRKLGNIKSYLSISRTEDDGYRKNTWLQRWNLFSKSQLDFDSSRKLNFSMNYLDQRRYNFLYWKGLDSALVPTDDQLGDMVISKRFVVNSSFKNIISDKLIYQIKGIWYHTNWRNNVEITGDHSRSNFINVEFQVNYQPSQAHIITTGIDLSSNFVNSNMFGNHKGFSSAVYFQNEYKVFKNVRSTLGMRFDIAKMESLQTRFQLNPKFGVSYIPYPDLSFRFSIGSAFRAPTVSEVFTSTTASGITIIPNTGLKSESSWGYEAGTNYKITDNLFIDAAIFQSDYKDLIEPKFVSSFTGQFINITRARIRGLEINLNTSWLRDLLNFNASYTYLDPEDVAEDKPLTFRSRHMFYSRFLLRFLSTKAERNPLDQFQIGVDFRYLSRMERIGEEFKLYIKDSEERVPIYVLDLSISQDRKIFNVPVKFSFFINNILNYHYVELVGNIAPLRSMVFKLETVF